MAADFGRPYTVMHLRPRTACTTHLPPVPSLKTCGGRVNFSSMRNGDFTPERKAHSYTSPHTAGKTHQKVPPIPLRRFKRVLTLLRYYYDEDGIPMKEILVWVLPTKYYGPTWAFDTGKIVMHPDRVDHYEQYSTICQPRSAWTTITTYLYILLYSENLEGGELLFVLFAAGMPCLVYVLMLDVTDVNDQSFTYQDFRYIRCETCMDNLPVYTHSVCVVEISTYFIPSYLEGVKLSWGCLNAVITLLSICCVYVELVLCYSIHACLIY